MNLEVVANEWLRLKPLPLLRLAKRPTPLLVLPTISEGGKCVKVSGSRSNGWESYVYREYVCSMRWMKL